MHVTPNSYFAKQSKIFDSNTYYAETQTLIFCPVEIDSLNAPF